MGNSFFLKRIGHLMKEIYFPILLYHVTLFEFSVIWIFSIHFFSLLQPNTPSHAVGMHFCSFSIISVYRFPFIYPFENTSIQVRHIRIALF